MLEVIELVQSQLTWIGSNSVFPDHMPQKTAGGLKMELLLLDFGSKEAVRLNTTTEKTMEKCKEFYKKICMTHNKATTTQIQEFLGKDQHLKNL